MRRYLDSSFENEFEYKGKKYRAVEKKRGDKHCSFLCAFGEHNCYGMKGLAICRGILRKDGRNVYFVEVKNEKVE